MQLENASVGPIEQQVIGKRLDNCTLANRHFLQARLEPCT
jgi:hypothetical protein